MQIGFPPKALTWLVLRYVGENVEIPEKQGMVFLAAVDVRRRSGRRAGNRRIFPGPNKFDSSLTALGHSPLEVRLRNRRLQHAHPQHDRIIPMIFRRREQRLGGAQMSLLKSILVSIAMLTNVAIMGVVLVAGLRQIDPPQSRASHEKSAMEQLHGVASLKGQLLLGAASALSMPMRLPLRSRSEQRPQRSAQ